MLGEVQKINRLVDCQERILWFCLILYERLEAFLFHIRMIWYKLENNDAGERRDTYTMTLLRRREMVDMWSTDAETVYSLPLKGRGSA